MTRKTFILLRWHSIRFDVHTLDHVFNSYFVDEHFLFLFKYNLNIRNLLKEPGQSGALPVIGQRHDSSEWE